MSRGSRHLPAVIGSFAAVCTTVMTVVPLAIAGVLSSAIVGAAASGRQRCGAHAGARLEQLELYPK